MEKTIMFWKFLIENFNFHDFSSTSGLSHLLALGASGTATADRESLKTINNYVSRRAGRAGTAAIDWENDLRKMNFWKFSIEYIDFPSFWRLRAHRSMIFPIQFGCRLMRPCRSRAPTCRPPKGTGRCLSWKYLAHAPTYFLERWNRFKTNETRAFQKIKHKKVIFSLWGYE